VEWTVPYYDKLQNTVGGGKPKMRWHFGQVGWPTYATGAGPQPGQAPIPPPPPGNQEEELTRRESRTAGSPPTS